MFDPWTIAQFEQHPLQLDRIEARQPRLAHRGNPPLKNLVEHPQALVEVRVAAGEGVQPCAQHDVLAHACSFEDKAGQTLLVVHEIYPSKEALDGEISSGSMSWNDETFNQLDDLPGIAATTRDEGVAQLRVGIRPES